MGTSQEAWQGSQDRVPGPRADLNPQQFISEGGHTVFPVLRVLQDTSLSSYRRKQETTLLPAVGEGDEGGPLHIRRERNLYAALFPWGLAEKGERQAGSVMLWQIFGAGQGGPLFSREYYWVQGAQRGPVWGTVKLFGIMRRLSLKGGPPVWNQGTLRAPP